MSDAPETDDDTQAPRKAAAPLSAGLSASNRAKINSAFDSGVAGEQAEDEQTVRPSSKRRRTNVVVDDEEDELESDSNDPVGNGESAGGFMLEDTEMGGGGFMPEEAAGGGGFVVEGEEEIGAGGFLPEDDTAGGFIAGGFDPMDTDTKDRSSPPIYARPAPPVNPFALLPLSGVPASLAKLRLRPGALTQLMSIFRGAADKNNEGEDCVSRQKFVDGCAVMILDGRSDDEEGEDDEEEEEEEYEPEESTSSAKKSATRATRSNPAPLQRLKNDVKGKGKAREVEAVASDVGELADSEESDGATTSRSVSKYATKAKGKAKDSPATSATKGKGRAKKVKDRNREMTKEELEVAKETFDLFFEDSDQLWQETKDRTIGMSEMRRVAKFLNEKIKDDEVSLFAVPLRIDPTSFGVLTWRSFLLAAGDAGVRCERHGTRRHDRLHQNHGRSALSEWESDCILYYHAQGGISGCIVAGKCGRMRSFRFGN